VKSSLMCAVAGVLALAACNRPEPSKPAAAETPAAAPKPVVPPAVGVYVTNEGSGDLSITANGNVSGTTHDGIYGGNKGNDLTITQGANSTVTGAHVGIGAVNYGDGDVAIIANGTVYGITYKWRTNYTDADLVTNALTEDILINTGSGTIRARARFGNEDNSLVPGMFVSVRMGGSSLNNPR